MKPLHRAPAPQPTTPRSSAKHRFDLATGYPSVSLELTRRALAETAVVEGLAIGRGMPEPAEEVSERLLQPLAELLGVPADLQDGSRTAPSGSAMIDRVMAAVGGLARARKHSGVRAIIPEPGLDVPRSMVAERMGWELVVVQRPDRDENASSRVVCDAIASSRLDAPEALIMVLLTSPENPTGEVWQLDDMKQILDAVSECGGVLIVDHCFAIGGLQGTERPSLIWDVAPESKNWVGLWDSGKTFDLRDEKIGWAVSADQELSDALDRALSVIQYRPQRRAVHLVGEVVGAPDVAHYLKELQLLCHANRESLLPLSEALGIPLPTASWGTFAWLDLRGALYDDAALCQSLLDRGVAVTPGSDFFAGSTARYVRVSLARDRDYFDSAVAEALSSERLGRATVL